jgi:hypothetical protein
MQALILNQTLIYEVNFITLKETKLRIQLPEREGGEGEMREKWS